MQKVIHEDKPKYDLGLLFLFAFPVVVSLVFGLLAFNGVIGETEIESRVNAIFSFVISGVFFILLFGFKAIFVPLFLPILDCLTAS